VHFIGLFFVFIIENARSKKQNRSYYVSLFLFLFLISYTVSVEDPGYHKRHNILLLISDNKSEGQK